jgi:integrase
MRRVINLLDGHNLWNLEAGKRHPDGQGLYLAVTPNGVGRSWLFRYFVNGSNAWMGIGSLHDVTLPQARKLAAKQRALKASGIDPLAKKRADEAVALASAKTFSVVAKEYMDLHKPTWRNAKHVQQWENTLKVMAYPKLGDKPVAVIEQKDVLEVLQARWLEVPETMGRLRGRIDAILDFSIAKGYRTTPSCAKWTGALKNALPKLSRIARIQHHPAMAWADLPAFMADLRQQLGIAARCLELTILCAVRTTEARLARWEEFDLEAAVWTIPATRMKAKREFRLPLSPRCVAILRGLVGVNKDYVFAARKGKPLSDGAMLALLDKMGRGHFTVHGFRSTFRDWCAECTSYPREIAELALAHINDDRTEAAYLRSDMFKRRRALMNTWASFTAGDETVRLVASAE